MKLLITYFLLLLLAIFIGLAISMHSGYVLIAYGNTVIEMTLWVGVLLLLCTFLLAYALLRSGHNLYHLPQTFANFLKNHRAAKAQRYFAKGLHRLLEKEWLKAEGRFAQAISLQKKHTITLTAYLAAAYAADEQLQSRKRDNYLNMAQKIYGNNAKAALTIAITRLLLFLHSKQHEEALALICHLRHTYPRHKLLLQKLQEIYVYKQDWRNLQRLLPILFRYKILAKEELAKLEKLVFSELWQACLASSNEKKITLFWRKMPRHLRYDADLADPYILFLEKNNAGKQAEKLLLKVQRYNGVKS